MDAPYNSLQPCFMNKTKQFFTTKMLSNHSNDGCPCIMVVDNQNSSSQFPSLHINIGKHVFLSHNSLNNEQRSTNVLTW